MASLYSASRAPMASSSSGEKGSKSRSCRTERMAFCDCQRQSSQSFFGTLRQSGWRFGLPGGSSSSKLHSLLVTARWPLNPDRSSVSNIKNGDLRQDLDIRVPAALHGRGEHNPIKSKIVHVCKVNAREMLGDLRGICKISSIARVGERES